MGTWSEPYKEVETYKKEDGGTIVVTTTFVNHITSSGEVDAKVFINREISGDVSAEEAKSLLEKLWELTYKHRGGGEW